MDEGITRRHGLKRKPLLVWVIQISFQFHILWTTYEIDNVAVATKFAVPSEVFISSINVKEKICSHFQ